MGRYKLKKVKDWKAKLRPYNYQDLFEKAALRTAEMGFSVPDVQLTDNTYLNPKTVLEFQAFVKREYTELLSFGLSATCVIIHTGLIEAVKEYFSCEAYLTTGSVTTLKAEMYPISEAQVRRWLRDGVDVSQLAIHTWITLDSLEILDFTFIPTVADVSRRPEFSDRLVATHPDLLPRAQPQSLDITHMPNGHKYNPFIIGREFLTELGLEDKVIHRDSGLIVPPGYRVYRII